MPYPEFPLVAHASGQWRKDIWSPPLKRSQTYYFGAWADDPHGERVLAEYMGSRESIANGTYRLVREQAVGLAYTVRDLAKDYLAARRLHVRAGGLAEVTYDGILAEISTFGEWLDRNVGEHVACAGLGPRIFNPFVAHLVSDKEGRKLGPWAERRVKSYIKSMLKWGADNNFYAMPAMGTGWKCRSVKPGAMRMYRDRMGIRDYSDRICTGVEIDAIVRLAPL